MAPELENSILRSSSTTEGLKTTTDLSGVHHTLHVLQMLSDLRDVGEVQGGRGWEDVGVVFGARLLEAVQGGVAVVFGQALILVAFTGKLDVGVFGQRDAQRLPMQPLTVQVAHSCKSVER